MPEEREDTGQRVLTLCALASGSRGNAIYVSDGETSILIDAGFSGKEIARRMAVQGLAPEALDAILVSHEHTDHIQAVGVLSRRLKRPVYISRPTYDQAAASLGKLSGVHHFSPGLSFTVGSLTFRAFPTSHDAADPAGFTCESHGVKIGIATDLGVATGAVRHHLKDCRALVLEANHDIPMLDSGPYPWPTKQRIKSRLGHLSNEAARDLLGEVVSEVTQVVVLGHLSETNNLPEKALNVVSQALSGHRSRLLAAHQSVCGELIRIPLPVDPD